MEILGTRDGDDQRGSNPEQGEDHVLTGDLLGQHLHRPGVNGVGVDSGGWDAELSAQGFEDGVGRGIAHLDQHPAEVAAGAPVFLGCRHHPGTMTIL